MVEILDHTPRGIKDLFPEDIAKARAWLEDVQKSESERFGTEEYYRFNTEWRSGYMETELALAMYGSLLKLQGALSRLSELAERGIALQGALLVNFTQRASATEQALTLHLVQSEAQYEGNRELLSAWFAPEFTLEIERSLKSANYELAELRIQECKTRLEALAKKLDTSLAEARDLERKQQKRLYVLKALRQVCLQMGFEESEPYYDGNSRDRKSNIVYQVDTIDRGKVVFYLSLDRINSHSAIAEDRCLEEFSVISENLDSEFGIKTNFGPENDKPDDRLLHKGELDLPEGIHMARSL